MQAEPPPRRRSLIGLTPLIDVVFILLIFFMLASNFLEWQSINLNTPADAASRGSSLEGSLLIEIHADGLRLSGIPVSMESLVERVGEHVMKRPGRGIFVRPAPTISLQETVDVLDALTGAGATNISLIKATGT